MRASLSSFSSSSSCFGLSLVLPAALLTACGGESFQSAPTTSSSSTGGSGGGGASTGTGIGGTGGAGQGGQGGQGGGCADPGLTSCGDAGCVDLMTSPDHCAACDIPCPVPDHAAAVCAAGVCGMGACEDGFGDCANGASDGCETPTAADKANCGGCGVTCTVACAASQCVNVKQISAGFQYTCATATDGSVYCWGNNTEWGNLGLGFANSFELSPKPVALPGPAVQVAANRGSARQHACAVLESGALYCWGANGNGQLGNGMGATELAPIEVPGVSDVVHVAVGGAFTCAVTAGQQLYCWGANGNGQVGVAGGDVSSPTPVLSGVKEVTTGDMFTCARTITDALKCFGADVSGQLGNGAAGGGYLPQTVMSLPVITHFGVGDAHACATTANGLSCWGEAGTFQLGNGGVTDQQLPIPIAVSGVERIALGTGHSGVIAGGAVWMWGAGSAGQIGNGAQGNATQPVDISAVVGLPPIADLSLGVDHSCAVDTSGKAYCWGGNFAGQIGNQTQNAALTPAAVVFP